MLRKAGDKNGLIAMLIRAFDGIENSEGLNVLQFLDKVRDYEFKPDTPVYSYYQPLGDMMFLTENSAEVDWEDSEYVIGIQFTQGVFGVEFYGK